VRRASTAAVKEKRIRARRNPTGSDYLHNASSGYAALTRPTA